MSSYDANLQPHGAQKPGITTKIADKLGMHKGDKVDDHHKVHGTHGTNVVGTANPQHDPLTHTTGHPTGHHTGQGLHDNDPNRIHAQDPFLVHEKDSKPGIGHKIADKLGLHKDDRHVHKDTMVQTPADLHNHPTGVYDNDPNRVQQLHTTQPVHTTNTPGVKDKVKHKLGMDKPHDHLHNTDNVVVGSHPVNPPVHHGTTHTAHTNAMAPEYQHNVNSPGVKDKVEHKLGMDKPHGYHNTDNVVVGGSHPVNTTHPHTTNTHGHTNVVNPEYQQTVNSPSIKDKVKHKLGMDKPHDQHHKDTTLLPKMTPQAEAGSVYSSSMINNNANANANANPTTIEHDRDGHAISTGYTTTGTTHDLPGDSGRMY